MSVPLSATLGEFVAADGMRLATYKWATSKSSTRACVSVVHGLGEHAGRYEALAQTLLAEGFSVRAHDHRGHRRSQGRRSFGGTSPIDGRCFGLVFTRLGAELDVARTPIGGAPDALRARPDLVQRSAPRAFDARPVAVAAYVNDPLVHSRVSARLIRGMTDNAPHVWAAAPQWRTPTLLMFAGDDALVSPAGSRRLKQLVSPEMLEAHEFDGMYHEIFNELAANVVRATLAQWLSARWPSSGL